MVSSHVRRAESSVMTMIAMVLAAMAAVKNEGLALATDAQLVLNNVLTLGEAADKAANRGEAAQVQTIIAGVVIGAALLVGFFVVAQIDSALPQINDADLSTDKNDTLDRIGDGLLIGGVVIIVLFAAVILRVLRGL